MYDKWYLSANQVKLVDEFHSGICPLLIYGRVGCGKTTLAKYLLKETLISVIDSIMIKDRGVVLKTIEDLTRKNITLMFQDKKRIRGLLIDDIHNFMKEDKKTFSSLVLVMEKGRQGIYRDVKIIVTSSPEIISHRALKKVSLVRLNLSRTKSDQYKIVKAILKSSEGYVKGRLTGDALDTFVHTIDQDFHQITGTEEPIAKDIFHSRDNFIKMFLSHSVSARDLVLFPGAHDTALYLNLLDALPRICSKAHLTKMVPYVYSYAVDGDTMDMFINTRHLWELSDYSVILYTYPYQLIPRTNYQPSYNKYISKSLIITHSSKINSDILSQYESDTLYVTLMNVLTNKIHLTPDIIAYLRLYARHMKYLKRSINSITHYYGIRNKKIQGDIISLVSSACT